MPRASSRWPTVAKRLKSTGWSHAAGAYCHFRIFAFRARSPRRCGRKNSRRPWITPLAMSSACARRRPRTGRRPGSTARSRMRFRSCTGSAMPIASRHGSTAGWWAASTASGWAAPFLGNRCSAARPTPRRWRSRISSRVCGSAASRCSIASSSRRTSLRWGRSRSTGRTIWRCWRGRCRLGLVPQARLARHLQARRSQTSSRSTGWRRVIRPRRRE